MNEPVTVSAVRTPVGRLGGPINDVTHRTMAALVMKEAVARAGIQPSGVNPAR